MKLTLPLALAASLWAGAALASPQAAPAAVATRTTAPHLAMPFVADDYARVLADARRRKVPVFVDNWALW